MENLRVFDKIGLYDDVLVTMPHEKLSKMYRVIENDKLFVTLQRVNDGELWRVSKSYMDNHKEMFELVESF